MSRSKLFVLVVAVGGLCAGVGAYAYAAIPSGGVITGCYAKSNGALRVVDGSSSNCKSTEVTLTWNQKGDPGLNGANGTNGADGTNGTDGSNGTNGFSGYTQVQATRTGPAPLSALIQCPAGDVAVGGGADGFVFNASGTLDNVQLVRSRPAGNGIAAALWEATVDTPDGAPLAAGRSLSITIYATCAAAN